MEYPPEYPIPNSGQHWTLDRRVPVALMLTVAAQTMGIVWWAATAQARIDSLERGVALLAPHVERVIRVEEKLGVVQQGIVDIKSALRERGTK